MNILLIVKNFDLGGTELHVQQLANELNKLGHKVHIMSRQGRQLEKLNENISHTPIKFSFLNIFLNISKIKKYIKSNKIQVIHGHQRQPISLAARVAKKSSIPSIATIHGQIKYDIRSNLVRKLLTHIIVVADNRISHYPPQAKILKKITTIYNGLPFPAINKTSLKKVTITYVSRIDRKHAQVLQDLITYIWPRIIHTYPDTHLNIIGAGDYLHHIEDTLEKNPTLKSNIHILGYKNNIQEHLVKSSLTLGVGRVAIESLSVNTPVISVNSMFYGGIVSKSNYLDMRKNNFVARHAAKYSKQHLTDGIHQFLANQRPIQENTSQLRLLAEQDFELNKSVKKIIQIYQSMTKEL